MDSSPRSVREVDTVERFSAKAADYARFRWDYDPQVFATLCTVAGLGPAAVVADIGAGPGTIARQLVDTVGRVIVVEPNHEMRAQAEVVLSGCASCTILSGRAEATGLPEASVDAITAGRAMHWFDPEPTRAEFRRILKTGGWLAIFSHTRTDNDLEKAWRTLQRPELGWRSDGKHSIATVPATFYYRDGDATTYRFPGVMDENWNAFLGRILSLSPAPNPGDPLYGRFEEAAREVFDRFSLEGSVLVHYETCLTLGRVT